MLFHRLEVKSKNLFAAFCETSSAEGRAGCLSSSESRPQVPSHHQCLGSEVAAGNLYHGISPGLGKLVVPQGLSITAKLRVRRGRIVAVRLDSSDGHRRLTDGSRSRFIGIALVAVGLSRWCFDGRGWSRRVGIVVASRRGIAATRVATSVATGITAGRLHGTTALSDSAASSTGKCTFRIHQHSSDCHGGHYYELRHDALPFQAELVSRTPRAMELKQR